MSIYRLEISVFSRSDKRNAVEAAAYRSGESLTDTCEYHSKEAKNYDYRRKQGVVASGIILPAFMPAGYRDRQTLWNAAERAEKRKNSRVAREALIALPHELSDRQRQAMTMRFARYLAKQYGVGVDYAIHRPSRQGDSRNHHAHVMFTTRSMTAEGMGAKTRELDDKEQGAEEIKRIRAAWETICNQALSYARHAERVSSQSLQARGINRLPEPKQGRIATQRGYRKQQSYAGWERHATIAYNAAVSRCRPKEQQHHIEQANHVQKRLRRANRPIAQWLLAKAALIRRKLRGTLTGYWQQITGQGEAPKRQYRPRRTAIHYAATITPELCYQLE